MKILEFSSVDKTFRHDLDAAGAVGSLWSRIYEYPLVLDLLDKYGANEDSDIHNTCWGYKGVHIWFKNILDKKYKNNINSDIIKSNEPNTCLYNLLHKPKEEWVEKFDFVLNVSTLEEVSGDHIDVFKKSFSMVKTGGYFICTFDLPGLQLKKFEELFGHKYEISNNPIAGDNSEVINTHYSRLKCGYMVIQK